MQMLPAIARGDANKVWVVPSELNDALKGLGSVVGKAASSAIPTATQGEFIPPPQIDVQKEVEKQNAEEEEALRRTVEEAIQEAHELERPVRPAAFEARRAVPALASRTASLSRRASRT